MTGCAAIGAREVRLKQALAPVAPAAATLFHVGLDETVPVKFNHALGGIVVGNPVVASVRLQDSTTLLITGKASGSTSIIVRDDSGRDLWSSQIAVKAAAKLKAA